MKKILYLTPQLPYPAISGGVIKSNKLIHFLSTHYELDCACLLKNDDKKNLEEFKKTLKQTDFYSEEIRIKRSLKNFMFSVLANKPLSIYRNFSYSFNSWVKSKANNYDVIFVDHFLMYQYIPKAFKGLVILHQHNAEYVMWERYAKVEKNIIKKVLIKIESLRIKSYEKDICNAANFVLAAPNDIEILKYVAKEAYFKKTLHLGNEDLLNRELSKFDNTEKQIAYIGTLSWEANADGLKWFLKEVWPSLTQSLPKLKFVIAGKGADEELEKLMNNSHNVCYQGFVEDLNKLYCDSRVFVAPVRFGSGIKVKTINAMYRGIPIITTSVGVEGLEVKNGAHIAVSDNAEDFIDWALTLLTDKKYWEEIQSNSRGYAKDNFTWSSVLSPIKVIIDGSN